MRSSLRREFQLQAADLFPEDPEGGGGHKERAEWRKCGERTECSSLVRMLTDRADES